jgi:hypothetical protein
MVIFNSYVNVYQRVVALGSAARISGWWYTYPLKNIFVSWDDDIPNIWNKIHFPNHDMLKMMLKHGEKLYMYLH